MKNKGISLIVLIITCVVIIILATAIIVNIAQTNMIENAKEAVVKQDFKTMQDELTLYKADKYADTLGKFKAEDLDIENKKDIAKVIPSIVGTKYETYVLIEDGNIAISQEMPEKERTWAMEALGLVKTSTNRPTQDTTAPTVPTTLELTVDGNNITAVASGSTDDKGTVGYEYSLDNVKWQENANFTNLKRGREYTVYARAVDKSGNKSETIEEKVYIEYITVYEYVSYTDTLNVAEYTTYQKGIIANSTNKKGTNYLELWKSQTGQTYCVFNEPVGIENGTVFRINYGMSTNTSTSTYNGSNFAYAFITDPTAYETAEYTIIDDKIGSGDLSRYTYKDAEFEYTGDGDDVYLVLRVEHPTYSYNTHVRITSLKIVN